MITWHFENWQNVQLTFWKMSIILWHFKEWQHVYLTFRKLTIILWHFKEWQNVYLTFRKLTIILQRHRPTVFRREVKDGKIQNPLCLLNINCKQLSNWIRMLWSGTKKTEKSFLKVHHLPYCRVTSINNHFKNIIIKRYTIYGSETRI
jgi:hypothetical protein